MPCVGAYKNLSRQQDVKMEDAILAQPKPDLFMHIDLYTRITSELAHITYFYPTRHLKGCVDDLMLLEAPDHHTD